jgi:hypothetical protein
MSSVDVQDVSHSIACCVDIQVVSVTLFTFEKSFLNAGMPDCPASGQSVTRMSKNADAKTSPVPEKGDPVRYRNAPVPDWDTGCKNADANAQLSQQALLQYMYVFNTLLYSGGRGVSRRVPKYALYVADSNMEP